MNEEHAIVYWICTILLEFPLHLICSIERCMLRRNHRNIRSSRIAPKFFSAGEPSILQIRFPAFVLNQWPWSLALASSSSRRCRGRRSTMHAPLVHWPVVSTRISSGEASEGFQPASSAVNAYQTQTGSCRLRSTASPTWSRWRLSMVRNVCAIKADIHSASGDPASRWGVTV